MPLKLKQLRVNSHRMIKKRTKKLNEDTKKIKDMIVPVEHHFAHLASTYFTSPYEKSVICSIDGFGDFISTMWGLGEGNNIKVND